MNKEYIETHFRITVYVYIVLLILQIAVCIIAYVTVSSIIVTDIIHDDSLRVFISLAGIIVMIVSNKIYNVKISKSQDIDSINSKLSIYRRYKIIQWGLILVVSLAALVVFIFTKDYFYVIIFLFMIGYFMLLRPSKQQLKTILKN